MNVTSPSITSPFFWASVLLEIGMRTGISYLVHQNIVYLVHQNIVIARMRIGSSYICAYCAR